MNDNKIIITVSGTDKVGIVAAVSTVLAKYEVNIEDIKQTLMQGHFVMFMLCDITNSSVNFKELKNMLIEEGNRLEVEIWVQKKGIFEKMHTV
jgi:ACT domain-containing protein